MIRETAAGWVRRLQRQTFDGAEALLVKVAGVPALMEARGLRHLECDWLY